MSKVADTFNGLGYLPLQHKGCIDTGWSVATMDSVICIRTNGRERTGDNAGAYGEVPECRGNLGGAVCWQVPPSSPRKIAMWNFAFPAVVTPTTAMASYSAAGTTSSGPSAGGHSPADGSYNVLPIRDESNTGDSRFYSFTLPRPDGYPKLPVGTLGVVVGGTEENREVPRFMSCDGRLVAVNFSGDAACGSVVCDLDKSNRVDNTRTARLQSAFRVIKNPVINGGLFGIIAKALPNCIAIQLGATGLDDTFGGLVYDKGAGDVMGALSHVNFGPISVGGAADQHQLGQDADGHPINSGHISLNAYFRNGDGSFDGPLMHSGEWKGANDAPYSTYVFMEYDASIPHPFALGTRFGRHRWRAKCFQYVPDTPTPAPHDPTTPGHPGDPKKPHDEPTPDGGGGGGPTDDPSHGGIPVVGTGDGGIPVGGVPIDPDDSIPNGGGSDVPPGWGPPPPGWGKDPVSPPAPKGSDPAPGDSPKGKAKGKAEGAGEKLKVGPLKGGDKGFGGWKGAPWGPFGLGKKGLGFGGWKDAPWGPFGLGKKDSEGGVRASIRLRMAALSEAEPSRSALTIRFEDEGRWWSRRSTRTGNPVLDTSRATSVCPEASRHPQCARHPGSRLSSTRPRRLSTAKRSRLRLKLFKARSRSGRSSTSPGCLQSGTG